MSVVVRIPEETYESAKRIAAWEGRRQPAEVLTDALEQYVEANREKLAKVLEQEAMRLRSGEGLAELGSHAAAHAETAVQAANN